MILEMEFSAQQIAQFVGGTVEGDTSVCVHTFAKIEEGVEGALSFLSDLKYEPYVYQTASSVLLVPNDFKPSQPVGATLVRVESPRAALGRLLQLYEQQKPRLVGIDPLASVDSTAKIGKDVYLGPFVTVAAGAEVGDGSVLHPHATVGAGAKVGCAMKVASGVSCAVQSAVLALRGTCIPSTDGIIEDDVEKTIRNIGTIGSAGMKATDRMILDIMLCK